MPLPSRDCALRTSAMAVADSRSELSALRTRLRYTRQRVNETRACVVASFALKAQAERLLENANHLFARR
jgi:hypothetical protein